MSLLKFNEIMTFEWLDLWKISFFYKYTSNKNKGLLEPFINYCYVEIICLNLFKQNTWFHMMGKRELIEHGELHNSMGLAKCF